MQLEKELKSGVGREFIRRVVNRYFGMQMMF